MSEPFSRRIWLLGALEASIAATLAALFYPVVRFLWPREATSSGAPEIVAPFHANELRANPDGTWPAKFTFNFGGKPCLVIRTPDKKIRAFDAVCTHLDCTVEFRPQEADIFCNCHNGVYDLNGRNVSGPPPRPLLEYKVDLRGKPGEEEIVVSRTT
ncbi:MAG: QcrA and Rieske domain-containing protein [Pirellulales bacterium]